MKGVSELELVITAPEAYAARLALRSRARMTLGRDTFCSLYHSSKAETP